MLLISAEKIIAFARVARRARLGNVIAIFAISYNSADKNLVLSTADAEYRGNRRYASHERYVTGK